MQFFAIFQKYDTGFGGHADFQRVLFLWAETQDAALAKAKEWEHEPDPEGYRYEYEVEKINPQPTDEVIPLFYRDNR